MADEPKFEKGGTISKGVWTTQLLKHIDYFNQSPDLREIKVVLPFGIKRERRPKSYKKDQLDILKQDPKIMRMITQSKLGRFEYDPSAEIKPWKPRQKLMIETEDQIQYKSTLLILRQDVADKKVIYLEQDLMARPIGTTIDQKQGYTYRLVADKNLVVRKYIGTIKEDTLVEMAKNFVAECNRVLFLFTDTI